MFYKKIPLDKGARKLVECLSKLPGKTAGAALKEPQCFRLEMPSCLSELENDTGKKFPRNLENGDTVCYKPDLGNFHEAPTWGGKTARLRRTEIVLGNYKTVLGKEEASRKVISKGLEDGLLSGHFPESYMRAKYPRVVLNSSDGGWRNRRSRKTRCRNTGRRNAGRCQPTHPSDNADYKT